MSAEELFNEVDWLPSPPPIAIRILEIAKRDEFSLKEISAVIESDAALTGRILRRVNSSFYSLPQKVDTIEIALAVLGVNAVKNLALSFTIPEAFRPLRIHRFDFDNFWRRSAVAAAAADVICRTVQFQNEDAFITALLQDIGIAAMAISRRDDYQSVLEEKAITDLPVIEIEKQIFGFDHQEMGARLLKEWGLPETIYRPIRYHHGTSLVPAELKGLCDILHISDRISAAYCGSKSVTSVRSAKEMLESMFDLDDAEADALVDAVADPATSLIHQLDISVAGLKPFSQMLAQAQQEFSLNMSHEMLVLEYKQANERSERLALELKAANDKLQDLASRDGLTGLYNHRHFQETIDKELARAVRYGRPCSLIMFDLDKFKSINDTHGHRCGDIVLRTIAEKLARTARKSDFVARYGGEEFAVILPETNPAGALTKAEACRLAIEGTVIEADGVPIRTTISGGVATFEPERPIPREKLIELADQALYRSKRQGGNRISVG